MLQWTVSCSNSWILYPFYSFALKEAHSPVELTSSAEEILCLAGRGWVLINSALCGKWTDTMQKKNSFECTAALVVCLA